MKKVFVYNTNREELAERIAEEFGDNLAYLADHLEAGEMVWRNEKTYLGITKDPDNRPYGICLCRDAYKEEEEGAATRRRSLVGPLIGFVGIEPDRERLGAWLRSRRMAVNLARHVVQEWGSSLLGEADQSVVDEVAVAVAQELKEEN